MGWEGVGHDLMNEKDEAWMDEEVYCWGWLLMKQDGDERGDGKFDSL